jgi:hypothetical protein
VALERTGLHWTNQQTRYIEHEELQSRRLRRRGTDEAIRDSEKGACTRAAAPADARQGHVDVRERRGASNGKRVMSVGKRWLRKSVRRGRDRGRFAFASLIVLRAYWETGVGTG